MTTVKTASKKPVIVTGVQPSGQSHIGNYGGMYRNLIALQEESADRYYFLADYHSITGEYDPAEKRQQSFELALDLLALGLDPKKSVLFAQSDVPEHTELAWIFNTITPMSFLERMTQYKDKAGHQKQNVNVGLFTYPVLQAADILIYHGTQVPVGRDQVQHLELTRDIARFFNNRFGDTFAEPKPLLTDTPKLRSLTDPLKKMSKSHGDKSCLYLNDDPDTLYKKLKSAVTESTGMITLKFEELEHRLSLHEPGHADEEELRGQAGVWNLITLLKLVGREDLAKSIMAMPPIKYGELKRVVAEQLADHFAAFREKRAELAKDPAYVKQVLTDGAEKARPVAAKTLAGVRRLIGID
jgi:tryptophanyl-tRNA synthetase